ncbi:TetR/AcrR family transcriptional regulator [Nesterenkonia ebinurensis]|uniref:TetR/AcrR family transcriptional regulator n=1 Tax=Nesterenkonia ebinurensis TaxID=2608252 RepID=UPI00123D33C8|nr:TetR/AcrR family transcriptional regulator [Nesterenkonia ebinurensis]
MTLGDESADRLRFSLGLLWRVGQLPKPGPKRTLTIEGIVAAAIAIADNEGIEALSMRRVADELGAGAMSLYRYVPSKTELLNLMLDHVHAPTDASGCTWREVTEAHARQTWRRYLAHPWLLQVNWSRPVPGPHMVADFDAALAALDGLGLKDVERVMIHNVVDGYVTGLARSYVLSQDASKDSEISDQQHWDYMTPILDTAVATGNYPTLAVLSDSAFGANWQKIFDFGLERLLDGLEQFIDNQAPDRDPELE